MCLASARAWNAGSARTGRVAAVTTGPGEIVFRTDAERSAFHRQLAGHRGDAALARAVRDRGGTLQHAVGIGGDQLCDLRRPGQVAGCNTAELESCCECPLRGLRCGGPSRSQPSTRAPWRANISAQPTPMPWPLPVTIATLPAGRSKPAERRFAHFCVLPAKQPGSGFPHGPSGALQFQLYRIRFHYTHASLRTAVMPIIRGIPFEDNLKNSMGLEFYDLSHPQGSVSPAGPISKTSRSSACTRWPGPAC